MTLQNLKYVVAVAEYGSFSAAAKALYISQSTLSSAIKELEAELGTQLFLRSNRGIQPTPDGEDFLRYAREIVEQSRALERRYRHRRYAPTRFAVSTQRLPFAVRAFQRFMEQLSWNSYDIAIRECPTYTIISDVAAGKSDVGVVALHDQYIPALEKTFEINHVTFTELERLPTYAFLRRSHPLAKRDKVSMAELLQYPFVTYDQEADRSEYTEEVVFHQIAEKTVHVSDRCSKVALVRFTDAFSIGPDLTNSNADAFHSGMGEIVAMPVRDIRLTPCRISAAKECGGLSRHGSVSGLSAGRYYSVKEDSLVTLDSFLLKCPARIHGRLYKNAPSGLSRMAHVSFVSVKLS